MIVMTRIIEGICKECYHRLDNDITASIYEEIYIEQIHGDLERDYPPRMPLFDPKVLRITLFCPHSNRMAAAVYNIR